MNSLQHGVPVIFLLGGWSYSQTPTSKTIPHGGIITDYLGNMTVEGSYELYFLVTGYITFFRLSSISQKGECCSVWRTLIICWMLPKTHCNMYIHYHLHMRKFDYQLFPVVIIPNPPPPRRDLLLAHVANISSYFLYPFMHLFTLFICERLYLPRIQSIFSKGLQCRFNFQNPPTIATSFQTWQYYFSKT